MGLRDTCLVIDREFLVVFDDLGEIPDRKLSFWQDMTVLITTEANRGLESTVTTIAR